MRVQVATRVTCGATSVRGQTCVVLGPAKGIDLRKRSGDVNDLLLVIVVPRSEKCVEQLTVVRIAQTFQKTIKIKLYRMPCPQNHNFFLQIFNIVPLLVIISIFSLSRENIAVCMTFWTDAYILLIRCFNSAMRLYICIPVLAFFRSLKSRTPGYLLSSIMV